MKKLSLEKIKITKLTNTQKGFINGGNDDQKSYVGPECKSQKENE